MSSTAGAIDRGHRAARDSSAVRLSAVISIALLGLLIGLAIVLVVRRLSGALVRPLSSGGLLLAAAAIESAVLVYRFSSPGTEYSIPSTQHLPRGPRSLPPHAVFSLIIPGLAAFILLASLTIRGTPLSALSLAWLLLISAESIQWLLYFRPELARYSALVILRPA